MSIPFRVEVEGTPHGPLYVRVWNAIIDALQTSPIRVSESRIYSGTGSPEGVVAGNVGDLFLRRDGSTSTTLYVKTSGTGLTGWTAK